MKILTNYDLIAKAKNAKENFTISKSVRNWLPRLSFWYAAYTLMDMTFLPVGEAFENATFSVGTLLSFYVGVDLIRYKFHGVDFYKEEAGTSA